MSTYSLFQSYAGGIKCQPMADARTTDDKQEKGDPELASRISQAIGYSGRPQRQIAQDVGVTAQSVTKWIRWGYMDKKKIPAFCRACGISIEWFLTGAGDIAQPNPLRSASGAEIIQAVKQGLSPEEQGALLRELADLFSKPAD